MLASVLFPSFIINRAVIYLVSLQAEGGLPDILNVRKPLRTLPPPFSTRASDATAASSRAGRLCLLGLVCSAWLYSDGGGPDPDPLDHPAARRPRALYDELLLPTHRQRHPRQGGVSARKPHFYKRWLHMVEKAFALRSPWLMVRILGL